MQKLKVLNVITIVAALLFLSSIGFAQKKNTKREDEKTTSKSVVNTMTQEEKINDEVQKAVQEKLAKMSRERKFLIPASMYSEFKSILQAPDSFTVVGNNEFMLTLVTYNLTEIGKGKMEELMKKVILVDKIVLNYILPKVVLTNDEEKDMESYKNAIINFLEQYPEVQVIVPTQYINVNEYGNLKNLYTMQIQNGNIVRVN